MHQLTTVLRESCSSRKDETQKKVVTVLASAVLLKFRNLKMKLMAAIFSVIIIPGRTCWEAGWFTTIMMHG